MMISLARYIDSVYLQQRHSNNWVNCLYNYVAKRSAGWHGRDYNRDPRIYAAVMWAYLLGHAVIAILHQIKGHKILQEIYSFKIR